MYFLRRKFKERESLHEFNISQKEDTLKRA